MKKLFAILLAIALALSLAACGGQPEASEPAATQGPSFSGKVEALPEATLQPIEKSDSTVRQETLKVDLFDYVDALNPWLEKNEVPILDEYYSFDVGTTKGYGFTVDSALSVTIYTPLKDEVINQIVINIDIDAAEQQLINAFGDICEATIYGIDYDYGEIICNSLDCRNDTDGTKNVYDSNIAGYVYSVDANIMQLFIMAKA